MTRRMKFLEKQNAVSEITEVEVNGQDVDAEGVDHRVVDEEQLDPALVDNGRKEEVDNMAETLKMFELGSWEDATMKVGKNPTTTKWVDRTKTGEEGHEFVRCRLVARFLEPRGEGHRDVQYVAMPPLNAKKSLFACRRCPQTKKSRRRRGGTNGSHVWKFSTGSEPRRGVMSVCSPQHHRWNEGFRTMFLAVRF